MKLNFWQIVGGILLLLGLIGIIYRESTATPANTSAPPAATAPATP